MKQNRNIGFLTCGSINPNEDLIREGVISAAQKEGCNLVCFLGGILDSPYNFQFQENILYEFATKANLDGVIFFGGGLAYYSSYEAMQSFFKKFEKIPSISIAYESETTTCLTIDNMVAFKNLVFHIIEKHKVTKPAFIRGTVGHTEADLRYQAYIEALKEKGIIIDEKRIIQGALDRSSGEMAVAELIKEKIDFDAIICANDNMALGAIEELQRNGIKIPEDIIVSGFDDIPEAKLITPPLTTVSHSFRELGERSVELLSRKLNGEKLPQLIFEESRLIIRESCGCFNHTRISEIDTITNQETNSLLQKLKNEKITIIDNMLKSTLDINRNNTMNWIEQLFDTFVNEMGNTNDSNFLVELHHILHKVKSSNCSISSWQSILTAMSKEILPTVSGSKLFYYAQELFNQASFILTETQNRIRMYEVHKRELLFDKLSTFLMELSSCVEYNSLYILLGKRLPELNITDCYLVQYVTSDNPIQKGLLLFAIHNGQVINNFLQTKFDISTTLPSEFLSEESKNNLFNLPLYFRKEQLGYIVFKTAECNMRIFKALAHQISASLKSISMFEKLKSSHNAMKEKADMDELTGVYNRRGFMQFALSLLSLAKRNCFDLTLIFIDLNNLKQVNDNIGHQTGDLFIKSFSDSLKKCFRSNDILSRLGGDEFCVLCSNFSNSQNIRERLNTIINKRNQSSFENYKLSFSAGFYFIKHSDIIENESYLDKVIKEADALMYIDKKQQKSS